MSKAKVLKLLNNIEFKPGVKADLEKQKEFAKAFLEYAQKQFNGNFSEAAKSIGEERGRIKGIFDRISLRETGTRSSKGIGKGSEIQSTIKTPEKTISYSETTTNVKADKNFLKNKIKNYNKNNFYTARDIANILGIDVSTKIKLDIFTTDMKRKGTATKAISGGTQGQKKFKLGDAVNKISKAYEKKLVKGQRTAQTERLKIENKLDPELKNFFDQFKKTTRDISKAENIFVPGAVEDIGHPLSLKITNKYPKLVQNSNINKIDTLTFQDPIINQKILEKTGYESNHDKLLKTLNKLVGKKIGSAELEELKSVKSQMNALHNKALVDIQEAAKQTNYLKGQENRLPKIDIKIPKEGEVFKSEDLFVDMSTVNPAFKVGLVDQVNPNAKFFKDLTKEQKERYKRNMLDQTKYNLDKFYTKTGFPKEQVNELKDALEFGTAEKLGIGTVGLLGIGSVAAAAEEKPKNDIIYNPEIGAVVNKETDDKVSQATILDWAADNPIYVAPIAAAPLLNKSVRSSTKKLLGGLLKTLGTPGVAGGLAASTIKSNLDEGKGIAESVLDPMVGIELLAPDVYKKFGGKGLTGLAGKILNLTPRIAGAMTPVGLGITAVGLGKMGYDAIQKDVQRMKDEGTYKDFLEEQEEIQEMGYGGA